MVKNHIPGRRWNSKIFWRRSGPENIHLDTRLLNSRRRSSRFSGRIRRVSTTSSRLIAGCRWSTKWILVHFRKLHLPPSRWTQSQTLLAEEKNHFPIPLKYIDVSKTTHTNLDLMQERRIDDYWNIDGSRNLSDSWTGFTQFTLLEEKPPEGFVWSGRRLTRKQLTSRPDYLWPELLEKMGKNAKLKERQMWSHEKLHLENATTTTQIRNKLDCWKGSSQSKRRHLCRVVAIRSRWKLVGRFYGVLHPICETSQIYYLMGRPNMKDVLEQPFKGPIIPFGSLVEYHPITAKDQSRVHQLGKKVLPGLFLGYALYAEGIWKGYILVADKEELETMDASEIYSKRLNAKEVIFPKGNGKFICPVADGRTIFLEEIRNWEHPTLIRDHPIRGESRRDFLGESEGSLPPPQDSLRDAGEANKWLFGPFLETSSTSITLNRESNATRQERNHSQFHWNI